MGGIMSGAGGSNGAPMLDGLNSGAPAPDILAQMVACLLKR